MRAERDTQRQSRQLRAAPQAAVDLLSTWSSSHVRGVLGCWASQQEREEKGPNDAKDLAPTIGKTNS